MTVSYTHLDVYKRQAQGLFIPSPASRWILEYLVPFQLPIFYFCLGFLYQRYRTTRTPRAWGQNLRRELALMEMCIRDRLNLSPAPTVVFPKSFQVFAKIRIPSPSTAPKRARRGGRRLRDTARRQSRCRGEHLPPPFQALRLRREQAGPMSGPQLQYSLARSYRCECDLSLIHI